MSITEKTLLKNAKNGDTSAFEQLVDNHGKFVFNLAYRMVGNAHEAEDLAQEAFFRAWKALPGFRSDSSFKTWLYRIVTNLCFDRLPGFKREMFAMETEDLVIESDERKVPEKLCLDAELFSELKKAIDELPDTYRYLIHLRHLQQLSYKEIAEVVKQPLGTVKIGIHRARQLLKKAINDYEEKDI